MKHSIIISTYNSPDWLQKVLWGYEQQVYKNFEIVIADDGSKEDTKQLIQSFQANSSLSIQHIWHEDNGFQKSAILNKAIVAAKHDYLIFSDGDCIPRNDFVAVHNQLAEKGYFLSGGYFMLPMKTSKLINENDIIEQNCFNKNWLYNNGLNKTYKSLKLTANGLTEKLLNQFTPTKATWNGHNASGWKSDILEINGHDERMQYGGQDRELGERLMNFGIKPKQIRYSAICVHLDHKRGYKNQESITKNLNIRKETKDKRLTYTAFGINKTK